MSATDFLAEMARSSEARSLAARSRCAETELHARIRDLAPAPRLQLSSEGFDLVAEMKRRSPAAGLLRGAADDDLERRVSQYAEAGAAAISVLTEPARFDGDLAHLERAAIALEPLRVPAMRKDFLVDRYQILEARVAGAGGVLLIVRMLSDALLAEMFETTLEQGLFVLLETFDERDIDRAIRVIEPRLGVQARASSGSLVLLGVNCRDLVTLQVIPNRLEAMAQALPAHWPKVAESGLSSSVDAERLARAGYDLALVGSALMTDDDPRGLAQRMLAAGRSARRRPHACS